MAEQLEPDDKENESDQAPIGDSVQFLAKVSETMGAGELYPIPPNRQSYQDGTRSLSCENLSPVRNDNSYPFKDSGGNSTVRFGVLPSDDILMKLDGGIGMAMHRAKVTAKYVKDIVTYIDKRTTIEAEYARSLLKLAQTIKPALKEESFLAFQSVYCNSLDNDTEMANMTLATCSLLQGHKFIEPIMARRNEHERLRKHLKDLWNKELKKMHECIVNMRKAKSLYIQRQVEYDRARESLQRAEAASSLSEGVTQLQGGPSLSSVSSAFNLGSSDHKVDRKRRLEDDALQKAAESEAAYKASIVEANERHQILDKVKADILQHIRELMLQSDQTLKAATVAYFQLQHAVSAPIPLQLQNLCENSRCYKPGNQYTEFVGSLSLNPDSPQPPAEPFAFERYVSDIKYSDREMGKSTGSVDSDPDVIGALASLQSSGHYSTSHHGSLGQLIFGTKESTRSGSEGGMAKLMGPMRAWVPGVALLSSDNESTASSHSSLAAAQTDTSPSSSPFVTLKHVNSTDDLEVETNELDSPSNQRYSRAATSHIFRKLKTPSRCRECDTYVYFQGVECIQCGLSSHKKCLEVLAIQCGHKRLTRRMSTFAVDLTVHVQATNTSVPHIVIRCIHEIDERGKHIKGIYRVSGVKSKVEKLCQSFENGAQLVDLSDIHPNVIANVLKLYLRQLPDPLLTYRLYGEFIDVAKFLEQSRVQNTDSVIVDKLRSLVDRLPHAHYDTMNVLAAHLKSIAEDQAENSMSAANLGIVFGPTLLRSTNTNASLSALVDTANQSKVVELLIVNYEPLFGLRGQMDTLESSLKNLDFGESEASGGDHQVRRFSYTDFGEGEELNSPESTEGSSMDLMDQWEEGLLLPDRSSLKTSPLLPIRRSKSPSSQSPLTSYAFDEPDVVLLPSQVPLPQTRNRVGLESTAKPIDLPRHSSSEQLVPSDAETESISSIVAQNDQTVICKTDGCTQTAKSYLQEKRQEVFVLGKKVAPVKPVRKAALVYGTRRMSDFRLRVGDIDNALLRDKIVIHIPSAENYCSSNKKPLPDVVCLNGNRTTSGNVERVGVYNQWKSSTLIAVPDVEVGVSCAKTKPKPKNTSGNHDFNTLRSIDVKTMDISGKKITDILSGSMPLRLSRRTLSESNLFEKCINDDITGSGPNNSQLDQLYV